MATFLSLHRVTQGLVERAVDVQDGGERLPIPPAALFQVVVELVERLDRECLERQVADAGHDVGEHVLTVGRPRME